jgi:hypothetical protein
MVALSVQAVRLFGVVVTPTPYLVDLLPFCEQLSRHLLPTSTQRSTVRHLPTWFPGTNFHKVAKASKETMLDSVHVPVNYVKKEMASPLTHLSSIVVDA